MTAVTDLYADLWREVQAIRVTLAARGLADWAERFKDGMTLDGDPGDILPATRRALLAVRESRLAPDLDARVDACVALLAEPAEQTPRAA